MIAKQTVFLTEDRKTAVPQGDPRARFKLVHVGQEISTAQSDKYNGALELILGESDKPEPEKPREPQATVIETREPETTHRDPKHGKHHR